MAKLSPHQAAALACLARGPLKYTVAGYAAATQANAGMSPMYVSTQTIDALTRRGLAIVHSPGGQRKSRRARITQRGRRLENGAR